MSEAFGVGYILFGVLLIATRNWSAQQLSERWNQRPSWTRWAYGPDALRASRNANVAMGIVLIAIGLAWLI